MSTKRLYCGAARGLITPPDELIPNLRGLRDSLFGGVLDDLFVRTIAVGDSENKALLIAFDLDKAPSPAENLAQISARTGIPEENIFFFSTHTHTAPITGFRPEERINDVRLKAPEVQEATAKYEQQVTDTLLRVVDAAAGGAVSGYPSASGSGNSISRSIDNLRLASFVTPIRVWRKCAGSAPCRNWDYRKLDETSDSLPVRRHCAVHEPAYLSTCAYHRILELARTIANLAGSENIQMPHVDEALQLDRRE